MPKPIKDVMKACRICINWGNTRGVHSECPYFNEEKCEDALQADVLYYLDQLNTVQKEDKR